MGAIPLPTFRPYPLSGGKRACVFNDAHAQLAHQSRDCTPDRFGAVLSDPLHALGVIQK